VTAAVIAHAGEAHATALVSGLVIAVAVVLALTTAPGRWRRREALTAAGLAVCAVAISPPVEVAAERTFAGHMAQHLLLLFAAPALLALGFGGTTLMRRLVRWLPRRHRTTVVEVGRRWHGLWRERDDLALAVAVAVNIAVVTLWHVPPLFAAAVQYPLVHGLEHVLFLTAGLALFTTLRATAARSPLSTAAATFAATLHGTALGALITFAVSPIYEVAARDGPAELADQQLAGVLMWVPGGLVYAGLTVRAVWLVAADGVRPRPSPRWDGSGTQCSAPAHHCSTLLGSGEGGRTQP